MVNNLLNASQNLYKYHDIRSTYTFFNNFFFLEMNWCCLLMSFYAQLLACVGFLLNIS